MGKYIKLFETHTEYQTYISGQDKILPNVSYCEDNNDVHYNPFVPETRIVATFNVTSTSDATKLTYGSTSAALISEMWIDGVKQDNVLTEYTFATTGEHTVKYVFVVPTTISNCAFSFCTSLTSVTIPNSVTSIGDSAFTGCTGLVSINSNVSGECIIPSGVTSIVDGAFTGCTGLTSVTIPNSVTSISIGAFYGCSGLTSITVETTTPPTLGSGAFDNTNNCPIYVPSASVDTYKAATNWSDYASRIQAIP